MRHATIVATMTVVVLNVATTIAAYAAEPMGAREGVYQRVLARPGARLATKPGDAGGLKVPPLKIFYVFERRDVGGEAWISVGEDTREARGWVKAGEIIEWHTALTGVFTNQVKRKPVLFFEKADVLASLAEGDKVAKVADGYREVLASGAPPPEFPVVASEPNEYVDPREHFYLLPILEHKEAKLGGDRTWLYKVAAVSRDENKKVESPNLDDFRVGVVFVVDTTKSMGPYIDAVRASMRRVSEGLDRTNWRDKLNCGLIGYRAAPKDPKDKDALEYVAKIFVDPSEGGDLPSFLDKIASVSEAPLSTAAFSEDAFLAVEWALEKIKWDKYGARIVVLVTDAGALEPDSSQNYQEKTEGGAPPVARNTGEARLGAPELNAKAGTDGVAIYVLHLKTPEGRANHGSAERQYKVLARDARRGGPGGVNYFPVAGGERDKFSKELDAMADAIVSSIDRGVQAVVKGDEVGAGCTGSPAECSMKETIKAFALEYYGRKVGTVAPTLVEGWAADRALEDPTQKAIDTRVLLTRKQLNDLHNRLRALLQLAQDDKIDPDEMFKRLKNLVVGAQIDPNRELKVADLVPFINGLPYKTSLLEIDASAWKIMPGAQRNERLRHIAQRLELYKTYYDDIDFWIHLTDKQEDWVYPVPLDSLP